MTSRPIPDAALDIVSRFEGFRAVAYLCPADVPTIGYGHTKGVTRADVGHLTITQDQARAFLREDLEWAAGALERAIGAEHVSRLYDHQYAALLSFVFNVGANPGWNIWDKIRRGLDAEVPAQLGRFVNAGGKRLPGLVARRLAEATLWSEETLVLPAEPIPASKDHPLEDHRAPPPLKPVPAPAPLPHEEHDGRLWEAIMIIASALLRALTGRRQ